MVETLSGFMWGVYPRAEGDPLVASGVAASVDQARREVERVLITDRHSSWGTVTGPGGYHSTCHRGRSDTFSWDQKSSGIPARRSGRPRRASRAARPSQDPQLAYWDKRARRARNRLASRPVRRGIWRDLVVTLAGGAVALVVVLVVLGVVTMLLSGETSSVIQRAEALVHLGGPAIEPEQEVENSIGQASGASVYSVTAKMITAMYQPGNGGEYMAICLDPQGMNNDASGISMADVVGWDCVLINDLSALMGAAFSGGADWTSITDLEPYLAADSVTRQCADATGGEYVSA